MLMRLLGSLASGAGRLEYQWLVVVLLAVDDRLVHAQHRVRAAGDLAHQR